MKQSNEVDHHRLRHAIYLVELNTAESFADGLLDLSPRL